MSDGTSSGIFGEVFRMLAEDPTEQHKEMASKIFAMTENYDFSYCEMEVGDELIKLDLAKMGIDPDYPEDGETIIYKGEEGFVTNIVNNCDNLI